MSEFSDLLAKGKFIDIPVGCQRTKCIVLMCQIIKGHLLKIDLIKAFDTD